VAVAAVAVLGALGAVRWRRRAGATR
jgi:hypothetical protein